MKLFQALLLANRLGWSVATATGNGKSLGDCDTEAGIGYGQTEVEPHLCPAVTTGESQTVQTIYSQGTPTIPTEPMTTAPPEPTIVCRCDGDGQNDGDAFAECSTNHTSVPRYSVSNSTLPENCSTNSSSAEIVPPVSSLSSPKALGKPTRSCSCPTAALTYFSPRVESAQASLETGGFEVKPPQNEKPHGTPPIHQLEPAAARIERPEAKLNGPGHATSSKPPILHTTRTNGQQSRPSQTTGQIQALPQPQSKSDTRGMPHSVVTVIEATRETERYIVHSQTLRPGAPATVLSGTTYSIPTTQVVLNTVLSGTTYSVRPTYAVIYVNGEPKPVGNIPGVQTKNETTQLMNGGKGESVAHTTSESVALSNPRVEVTQTRLAVPTGTPKVSNNGETTLTTTSSSSTASGGSAGDVGSQTPSGPTLQEAGSASVRLGFSVFCLIAMVVALAML